MDAADLIQLLNKNKEGLSQILAECNEGSSELTLLASKMEPLLAEFSSIESALSSRVLPDPTSNKASTPDNDIES